MLYEEFLEGTGCKDKACNYKVYKDLEILYMNSNLTKEQIYEYGKKLVDNSLTDMQLAWNANIDDQIDDLTAELNHYKKDLERYIENRDFSIEHGWEDVAFWKREISFVKGQIRSIRTNIKSLKECKYV